MKKALIITDCTIDQAILTGQWLKNQPEPVALTIVYAYALAPDAGQPLKAAGYRMAKQEANDKLSEWLNFLPGAGTNAYQTEVLPGNPELLLQIYVLLRQYDYMLIDFRQQDMVSAFAPCAKHIPTQLRYLSRPAAERTKAFSTGIRNQSVATVLV